MSLAVAEGSLERIGRELGVSLIVTATVTLIEGQLRVDVNLDDIDAGQRVWTRQYTGLPEDLLTLEDRVYDGLVVAPDRLSVFGPLFTPVNPQNAQSEGFRAGAFSQGIMGAISGVPVIMSAGLGNGEAYLFSTAALEAFEQRVGTLQVTEPSVLGVQVAYAGYFTPMTIEEDGIVPLDDSGDPS
jgi:hypothetical protein